jgi:hypothetical protein
VRRGFTIAAVIAVAAATGEPVAHAQRSRAPSARPVTEWSRGVSDANQRRALQLFQQGNVFFEQAKYTDAVAKYELALAAWDNPNIRFNMAVCLINMRQPLVAWEHLTRALRFGEAPLGKRLFSEAMTYQAALTSSLAELTVKTTQPEVKIMVDGGQVLVGNGEHTMKLLAGKHQLVATRTGYVTDSRALDLPAGEPVMTEITLTPEKVKVKLQVRRENYERRWRWWLPWAVAGSSVVFGAIGGGLYASARSEIRRYDDDLRELCPMGCDPATIPEPLKNREAAARRKSGIAIGMWCGAGALAITGGVMAILNRPRKVEERTSGGPGPTALLRRVVPELALSRDYVGVGLSVPLE